MERIPEEWSHALVSAPLNSSLDREACAELIKRDVTEDTTVLYVTFVQSPEDRLDVFREHDCDVHGARAEVLHVATGSGWTSAEDAGAEPADGSPRIGSVTDPRDLTRLGLAINKRVQRLPSDRSVEVCFHSLTALLQFVDADDAFRFIQTLNAFLMSVDGRVHYHVDPGTESGTAMTTLRPLFDVVFEGESLVRSTPIESSTPTPEPTVESADAMDTAAGTDAADVTGMADAADAIGTADATDTAEEPNVPPPTASTDTRAGGTGEAVRIREDGPLPELDIDATGGAGSVDGPPGTPGDPDHPDRSGRSDTDRRTGTGTGTGTGTESTDDAPSGASSATNAPEADERRGPRSLSPAVSRTIGALLLVVGTVLAVPGTQFALGGSLVAWALGRIAALLPVVGVAELVRAGGIGAVLVGAVLVAVQPTWATVGDRLPRLLDRS